jgi:hypothetical protein
MTTTERTIQCIGTVRGDNDPLKFNIRVRTGNGAASVYPVSLDEAVELRRELTDFLAAHNVPANF